MAIEAFSNLNITISDGGTVASVDSLTNKTYVDIGSGNILKVSWNTPTATNNKVDSYIMNIFALESTDTAYKSIYKENIGSINEFYLRSSMLNSVVSSHCQLRIYIEVVSKYGSAYNGISQTENVSVSRGSGMYIEVADGLPQPIMKRAVAFTKLDYVPLRGTDDLALTDVNGEVFYTKAAVAQSNDTGWTLMQYFYTKDTNNAWQASDMHYEVLIDNNGEIVTDLNNEQVLLL